MKRSFSSEELGKSKKPKYPSLTITGATFGTNFEPGLSTSTSITSTGDPVPSVVDSAATASVPLLHTTGVAIAHELQAAASVSDIPAVNGELPAPSTMIRTELGSTKSEWNPLAQHSGLGPFPNAQNLLITGGTFISAEHYNVYNLPAGTSEVQTVNCAHRKQNSSPLFTGRKDVLDELRKIFVHRANSRPMLRRSCLLWGMGGIGKTQICLKFIEEMCDSFSHVFWVDASSLESIKISLKAISSIPIAQTSGMHGSVESVLQGISHIQEEWLIVFDNADDPSPEVVAKFIPPGNRGNILITSRNRSMGRVISFENMFEINEMEESDAIALLLNASHLASLPEHQEAATKIVTELGCVPLAVDQAGAYIEAGKCDINEYLRRLSLHRKTLMSDNAYKGASEYDKTVYGTWELSFKEIEKRAEGQSSAGHAQAAQAAILILQICAFYHHGDISKKIFQSAAEESAKYTADSDSKVDVNLPLAITSLDHTLLAIGTDGQWDDMTFSEGISVLLSFSLVKRGQSSEMLSVHPLVHCWSRERMSKAEQQQMCEIGSLILSCAITLGDTSQDYAFRRLLFPHIKANELHGNQIGLIRQYYDDKWDNFSKVLKENGDWNRAEQLEVQVMDMRKELLGEEHPDTITSIGNLANIYSDQGKWNEAEQLKVHVMGMSKKLLGEEHPDTLIYMENLAITYGDQGRWNEAEQLIVEVMDMRKKLLGEEHPDTLSSMANIAGTYSKQGRWNEAEQLDLHVMDMRKKLLGEEHPDTIRSMANLARTYSDQGRWNEAEQLDVQVMDMRMKLLDAEHPDILRSMADLASTYSGQGRWNEAEKLQVQVMDMSKKLLGAGHPDTLIDMGNLASTYSGQGRWNEAEQMMVQVKNMMMKLFSADHPDTLTSMANLARIYSHQGRWNEAEQLDVHVMDMRKKLHGEEHPDTLTSMENIARTYSDQGRWNEAEQLDVHVMDMRKKLLGEEHPDTIRSVANLARTYSDQGRWNEAKHLWVQVMEMRKKLLELRLSSQLEQ